MLTSVVVVTLLSSFQSSTPPFRAASGRRLAASSVRCAADRDTAGRGFGAAAKPPSAAKPPKAAEAAAAVPAVAPNRQAVARSAAEERGRKALEALRVEAGAQPANPLKKVGPALTPEEEAPMDPTAGVMPEVVSQRMLRRVVPFAALPVFGGVLTFGAFYYANVQLELDVPPTIVAYATQALLLLSFAGITYGVMSTSWDEVCPAHPRSPANT